MRYRQLEWLELLRLLSAASIGNDRQVGESWTGWGNLRRQLSAEPALIYSMVVMGMESRHLDALERVVNEFGIHSDREMRLLDADLAASEKELAANLEQGLRGEVALSLISGLDPMVEWSPCIRPVLRVEPVVSGVPVGAVPLQVLVSGGDGAVPERGFGAAAAGGCCGVAPGVAVRRGAGRQRPFGGEWRNGQVCGPAEEGALGAGRACAGPQPEKRGAASRRRSRMCPAFPPSCWRTLPAVRWRTLRTGLKWKPSIPPPEAAGCRSSTEPKSAAGTDSGSGNEADRRSEINRMTDFFKKNVFSICKCSQMEYIRKCDWHS